jgi:hypothetical protein
MRKLFVPSLAAFVAGLNVSFATDEKNPGEASPTLQFAQIAPERSTTNLPEAKQLNADEARALEAIGTKVFGVKWGERLVAVSDHGFQVVTDHVTTLPETRISCKKKGKSTPSKIEAFRGQLKS